MGPEVGAVPPGATARKAKPLLGACLPNREKRAPKAELSQGRNGQCQDPAALALRHCLVSYTHCREDGLCFLAEGPLT